MKENEIAQNQQRGLTLNGIRSLWTPSSLLVETLSFGGSCQMSDELLNALKLSRRMQLPLSEIAKREI